MGCINTLLSYYDILDRKRMLSSSIKCIKEKNESFVIMFHDVNFENRNSDKYGINISDFKRCIMQLRNRGYRFVLFSDLEQIPNHKNSYCVLTFDDGYYSAYQLMREYLIENEIPFHIFVTTDWIDKDGCLSEETIAEMSKESLCNIGSHSKSHPFFRKLPLAQREEELLISKQIITNIIQKEIHDFAFPYGSRIACSPKNIQEAYKTGYLRVYSTAPKTLKYYSCGMCIPRIDGVELMKHL